ncbi:MAG: hypothetical protein M1820_002037 [Bogoriella megaspora]|nr:MAG: hypothetical protein M1820_002037 [Bogoriella megaspora]
MPSSTGTKNNSGGGSNYKEKEYGTSSGKGNNENKTPSYAPRKTRNDTNKNDAAIGYQNTLNAIARRADSGSKS